MRSALYVGRVGALAVALGIGAVIAGVPGVAWAGAEGEADPSNPPGASAPSQQDNPDADVDGPVDGDVDGGGDPGGGSGGDDDPENGESEDSAGGGMKVGSSGGPITSTTPGSTGAKSNKKNPDSDPSKKRLTITPKVSSVAPPSMKSTTQMTGKKVDQPKPTARAQTAIVSRLPQRDNGPQVKQPTGSPSDVTGLARVTSSPQPPVTTTM